MRLRVQRVASVANWDRPRVVRYWNEQDYEFYLAMVCISVILAGTSYELWVRL